MKPHVLVCLGATAAQALLGKSFKVSKQRGEIVESTLAPIVDRDRSSVLDPARAGRRGAARGDAAVRPGPEEDCHERFRDDEPGLQAIAAVVDAADAGPELRADGRAALRLRSGRRLRAGRESPDGHAGERDGAAASRRSRAATTCASTSADRFSPSAAGSCVADQPDIAEYRTIQEGLYLSSSPELLRRVLEQRPAPRARVIAGYAGWGPGQLDEELAQSAWLIGDVDLDLIFDVEAPAMWDTAIRRLGADPSALQSSHGIH